MKKVIIPRKQTLAKADKYIRKINKESLRKILQLYLVMDLKDLKSIIAQGQKGANSDVQVLKFLVASTILRAIKDGDERKLEWFMYKLFGRDIPRMEITHHNAHPDLSNIPTEQILAAVEKLNAETK